MGGRGHGQRLHAAKESDSGDGDGDSLDPGAIVVLNELIIGERKNTFCVCVGHPFTLIFPAYTQMLSIPRTSGKSIAIEMYHEGNKS